MDKHLGNSSLFYGLLSISDPFRDVEKKKIGESFHHVIRSDYKFADLVRFMTEGRTSNPFHALNQHPVFNFILNLDTVGLSSNLNRYSINTRHIATLIRLYLTQVVNSCNPSDKLSLPNNNNPFMSSNSSNMIHSILGYDKLLNGQYRQRYRPGPNKDIDFLTSDRNLSQLVSLTVEAFIIQLVAEDSIGGNEMNDAPCLLEAIANFNKATMQYPLRVLFNPTMHHTHHRGEDWYLKLENDGFEPQQQNLCISSTPNPHGGETHDLICETTCDGSYDELAEQVGWYLACRDERLRDYSELLQRGLIFVVKPELFAKLAQDPAFFPYKWTEIDQYDSYKDVLRGDKCVHIEDDDIACFLEVIVKFNANMPFAGN
jgi:hypothetical protein